MKISSYNRFVFHFWYYFELVYFSSSPYFVRIVACWSRLKFSENIANPSTIVCIVRIRSDYLECVRFKSETYSTQTNEWMNGLKNKNVYTIHVYMCRVQKSNVKTNDRVQVRLIKANNTRWCIRWIDANSVPNTICFLLL